MSDNVAERYVVLKGTMYFKDSEFKDRTKRLAEAGLFSLVEAEAAVRDKKGDAVTYQPLSFYRDFLLVERDLVDEKLRALGINE